MFHSVVPRTGSYCPAHFHHDYQKIMTWSLLHINFAGVALKEGEKFEYVIIYEDKDRDWMLVGDVPWQYVYITLH